MKKILKTLVLVTLFALVVTAFTACSAQELIDKVTEMFTGQCQHEVVTDPEVLPTCTAAGLTEGYHCSKCDEVILPQYEKKALGHKIGTEGKEATCTEAAVCGTCEQSFGEPLGHDFADATCVAPKTCKVEGCGATEGNVDPENHTYADATCVAPAACVDCQATTGEPNPMNHNFGADYVCVDCHVILVTIYYKNTDAWEAVNLYAWTTTEDGTVNHVGAWPGAPMEDLDYYGWFGTQFIVASTEGMNIIFNGGEGKQTGDLAFDAANIYWANGKAYASVEAAEEALAADTTVYSDFAVRGGMNGWGMGDKLVVNEDGTASLTMTFEANVEFKVSNEDWSKQFGADAVTGNENFAAGEGGNIKVVVAGTYTITVSADGQTMTITPAQADAE